MLFPPHPQYAETHYKFQLPFSRLYRKQPELLVDAPSRVVPGEAFVLWVVAKDSHLFPFRLLGVSGEWILPHGVTESFRVTCDILLNQPFHFVPFTIPRPSQNGYTSARVFILGELQGKRVLIERWNYPHLSAEPLMVHFLSQPPPQPKGWMAGETHCHTWYSSDPVEFGATPAVLQSAARMVGLDFVFTTDHSYDFAWDFANYMRPADPEQRFAQLRQEIKSLPPGPLLIAGEEVSCGNHLGQNVHLLVPGCPHYIPGQGDGGRRWLNNQPDLTIAEVLERSAVPCFAAHPQVPMGWLERQIFRRGSWNETDLHIENSNPVAGLQFWNGSRDCGFDLGRRFWITQLLQGRRILPIGGNDAHGDLNDCTGVQSPLWSLKHSRHHLFGHVRTLIPPVQERSVASILSAFRKDNLYITDGPALWWERESNVWCLHAQSTSDFGALRKVVLFSGTVGETSEQEQELSLEFPWESNWKLPTPAIGCYCRAECHTQYDFFALTSAYFHDE